MSLYASPIAVNGTTHQSTSITGTAGGGQPQTATHVASTARTVPASAALTPPK